MASDGLANKAKHGKCRMCYRTRKTEHLAAVGEVRHGFATGHIWECKIVEDCELAASIKLREKHRHSFNILLSREHGRFNQYKFKS